MSASASSSAGQKAMIQDNTRCIGCRACMVACKEWNLLEPDEAPEFFAGDGYQNPIDLDEKNYTLITYQEDVENQEWVFGRLLCQHCLEPACASACPTGALTKNPLGSVDFNESRCIGCRYCMQACPFVVPKFDFGSVFPKIHKCTMCADRVQEGLDPACATVCPTHAIEFGDRDVMVAEAERRVAQNPGTYVPHIYGKDEVGGTNVLHLSSVPFEKLGYQMGLPNEPLPNLTHKVMRFVPSIFFTLLAFFSACAWMVRRRIAREEEEAG
jgi:formate dehydrogenase iron-sulfur subunit